MRLPHITPFSRAPIYFLTACVAGRRPLLNNQVALKCFVDVWEKCADLDGWFIGRFVLMPDHVHLFALPSPTAKNRSSWLKVWKPVSARRLLSEFQITASFWQADTFDHILRSADSYSEKWEYVRNNPVRDGLVERSEEWPWQGEIHSLAF